MATVFCFSSTGNSLFAAKRISEEINADLISMTQNVNSCSDEVIGFVFPIYFWGAPKIVERFITHLGITNNNAYIFEIATHGDGNMKKHGVLGAVEKILARKNIKISYANTLKSVENYIPMYKVNDNEELHKQVSKDLGLIISDINIKKHNTFPKPTILNKLVHLKNPANKGDCDKSFIVSDDCTGCSTCEKICPVNNIHLVNHKPEWGKECTACLACFHWCPKEAVFMDNSIVKKRRKYHHPDISINDMISERVFRK